MFKTRITELLGIKYPIIQGAMLWLARAELAAAVSNAGGMGIIIATAFPSAEEFRQEIRKMRSLSDKPFAVNITLMPRRHPINWESYIAAAIEEGVSIIETAGRSPEPYMKLLRQPGVKLMHKVARVMDAQHAERLGVDAVTIVGSEAGGHPGMDDVPSLVLIAKAANSLKIPVIAAGGFTDGRGLVAALALGAEGVLMGTRFMASKESVLHPKIKDLLLRTREMDTMVIMRAFKHALRVIRTDFSLKVLEMEENGATLEEMFPLIHGERVKKSYISGSDDALLYCGQGVGLINDIPSAKEIIERIVYEAELTQRRLINMDTVVSNKT